MSSHLVVTRLDNTHPMCISLFLLLEVCAVFELRAASYTIQCLELVAVSEWVCVWWWPVGFFLIIIASLFSFCTHTHTLTHPFDICIGFKTHEHVCVCVLHGTGCHQCSHAHTHTHRTLPCVLLSPNIYICANRNLLAERTQKRTDLLLCLWIVKSHS